MVNSKSDKSDKIKMIEIDHICKNLVSQIWSGAFLVNFRHTSHYVLLFLILTLKYRFGRLSKMKGLCDFHINYFSSFV